MSVFGARVPTTRAAIGSERAFQNSMIEVSSASFGTSRVTRWLVEVTFSRTTWPLRLLMTRCVSVSTWPKDAALVTIRDCPSGSGMAQT